MKHANDALGCLYELEANCQFNNLTMECHSLPGDDNLPKTVSNDPLPCGAGQAYCGNTRTGEPMCVGEMQGKCMNCIDTSIVDDSRWVWCNKLAHDQWHAMECVPYSKLPSRCSSAAA